MDTRGVIDVMLDNPNVDSFVREKEERVEALEREAAEARRVLDDAERAGGDAPHRALSIASRVKILAMQQRRDEEVLVRDACGLERVMRVAVGYGRLRLPVRRPLRVSVEPWRNKPVNDVRDFDWRGQRDAQGRRILEEVV
jgi:hypothetical protein